MKHLIARLALLGGLATAPAALAQDSCAPLISDSDDCLTGAWIGSNTIAERISEMLQAMAPAGVSRQVFPDDYARVIGWVIYPDGFFASLPFATSVTIHDLEEGELTIADFSLAAGSSFGWVWTAGSSLRFCNLPGSTGLLRMQASSSGGSGATLVDVEGDSGFMPEISYTCAGNSLSMSVALPAPIGTVEHYFTRVPSDRFDDEMRAIVDSRFAPADTGGD